MKEAELLGKIYPSVVTWQADWRRQISEVKEFKLSAISLFLTAVKITQRREIYELLTGTAVQRIPHIHIRQDMAKWELNFLVKKFKTKVFSLHFQYLKNFSNLKYKKQVFIENNRYQGRIKNLAALRTCGGVCIDLSHLEEDRLNISDNFFVAQETVAKYKVGCNHLSAVKSDGNSCHLAKTKKEFDYLLGIPQSFFSPYVCLELQNSIKQQLEFRKYLARILAKNWSKQ